MAVALFCPVQQVQARSVQEDVGEDGITSCTETTTIHEVRVRPRWILKVAVPAAMAALLAALAAAASTGWTIGGPAKAKKVTSSLRLEQDLGHASLQQLNDRTYVKHGRTGCVNWEVAGTATQSGGISLEGCEALCHANATCLSFNYQPKQCDYNPPLYAYRKKGCIIFDKACEMGDNNCFDFYYLSGRTNATTANTTPFTTSHGQYYLGLASVQDPCCENPVNSIAPTEEGESLKWPCGPASEGGECSAESETGRTFQEWVDRCSVFYRRICIEYQTYDYFER